MVDRGRTVSEDSATVDGQGAGTVPEEGPGTGGCRRTTVRLEQEGRGVWSLVLDNPPVNAVTPTMNEEMLAAVDVLASDAAVRAVVVRGAGGRFCGGADLDVMERLDRTTYRIMRRWIDVENALERLEKPVLCAIERFALGGGAELALACDLRVLGSTAQIGFPETDMGLFPGAGGTQRLARLLGPSRAFRLMAEGTRLLGDEARQAGIVDEVVDDDAVVERTLAMALHLAGRPTRALGLLKRAVYEGWGRELSAGLQVEEDAVFSLIGSDDVREGIRAFHEHRTPVFEGR